MLSRNDVIALLQATPLSGRVPSLGTTGDNFSGKTGAWADGALRDEEVLDQYVAGQGLDRRSLEALLNGGAWIPRDEATAWLQYVEQWLLSTTAEQPRIERLVVENTVLESIPFPEFFGPIIAEQSKHLDRWSRLSSSARSSLLTHLGELVATLSLRCLLAELADDGDYGRLNEYLGGRRARVDFLIRYPVLAHDLIAAIRGWREQVDALLSRLIADTRALQECGMLSADVDSVKSVRFAGDRHDSGQSVAILTFDDGKRVVYKPRDCGLFVFYRDLIRLLAPYVTAASALHAPKALNRSGYGWVEFVPQASAGDIAPGDHLQLLGALLGIAHALGASDLHLENVIASARGPVPVDMETLIQNRSHDGRSGTAAARAVTALNASVLGTGILPVQLTAGEGTSIDVSVATGGLDADSTRNASVHQIVEPFTNRMRIAVVSVPVGRSNNQPPGMTADIVRDNRSRLIRGFTEMSRAIIVRRAAVIELVASVPSFEIRHIVRATRSYSLLLTEMRQPARLRNGIERDHLLRSLWTRLAEHPGEESLIKAEERALRELDVPLFCATLDSRALTARRHRVLPTYFEGDAREDVISRIAGLDDEEIAESSRLIEESILAATPRLVRPESWPISAASSIGNMNGRIRDLARRQASTLLDSAILGDDDVTWLGVASSTDSSGLDYRPLGPTLYDGLAGITFATTYADRVLPGLGLDDLAHRTARAIAAVLGDWTEARLALPIGAFSGVAGLIYALSHYDVELGGLRYRQAIIEALRRLAAAVRSDAYFDIMAGTAGALAVVTSLPDDIDAEAVSQTLVRHLLDHAVETDDGDLAWETGNDHVRLGGFSHGATGIGWALAKAGAVLNDSTIAHAARAALRFDESLFDMSRRRWLDARPESLERGRFYPAHWCHGAAGIAMARVSAAVSLDDDTLYDQAAFGAQETAAGPLPADDSLCHGALGNLLALREVVDGCPGKVDVRRYRDAVLSRLQERAPRSGLPEGVTTVRGLMLGTAGSLLALSREAEHDVPNPLVLQ